MSSEKSFLETVTNAVSDERFTSRPMMGEYVLYFNGKVIGGIYDDRLLVKPTEGAKEMIPNATMKLPYDGAKEMIAVEDIEDGEFLRSLFEKISDELPYPKKKRAKK